MASQLLLVVVTVIKFYASFAIGMSSSHTVSDCLKMLKVQ